MSETIEARKVHSKFKIQYLLSYLSQVSLHHVSLVILMNHDLVGGGKIKGDAKTMHIKKESIKCPEFIMASKQLEFLPNKP